MEKKKKKKGIIIFIVAVVFLLCGIGIKISISRNISELSNNVLMNQVETQAIEYRDISNYISVSGNVESENLLKITSTVNAKILSLNVELGSHVNEGDILCVFDSSDFQQQYDTLLKTMENSKNLDNNTHKINQRNLEKAKQDKEISLAQAQRNIDNAISARDKAYQKESDIVNSLNQAYVDRDGTRDFLGTVNQEESPEIYADTLQKLQELELTVKTKEETLDAVREQLSAYDEAVQSAYDSYSAVERNADTTIQSYQDIIDSEKFQQNSDYETELKKIKDEINACTVRATKSGIITSLNVAEGSIPTTDALMTIEDTNAVKIKVQINEADILNVHEGMTAVVKTSATGDNEYNAVVSRVVNIYTSDMATGAGGYSAEITLDDTASTDLLIGMNAKVRIVLDEKKNVLAVPYDSIITDENGKSHILLAVKDGEGVTKAKSVDIEKGIEGTYYTEIISADVHDGDVLVSKPDNYHDGDILPISELQENSHE